MKLFIIILALLTLSCSNSDLSKLSKNTGLTQSQIDKITHNVDTNAVTSPPFEAGRNFDFKYNPAVILETKPKRFRGLSSKAPQDSVSVITALTKNRIVVAEVIKTTALQLNKKNEVEVVDGSNLDQFTPENMPDLHSGVYIRFSEFDKKDNKLLDSYNISLIDDALKIEKGGFHSFKVLITSNDSDDIYLNTHLFKLIRDTRLHGYNHKSYYYSDYLSNNSRIFKIDKASKNSRLKKVVDINNALNRYTLSNDTLYTTGRDSKSGDLMLAKIDLTSAKILEKSYALHKDGIDKIYGLDKDRDNIYVTGVWQPGAREYIAEVMKFTSDLEIASEISNNSGKDGVSKNILIVGSNPLSYHTSNSLFKDDFDYFAVSSIVQENKLRFSIYSVDENNGENNPGFNKGQPVTVEGVKGSGQLIKDDSSLFYSYSDGLGIKLISYTTAGVMNTFKSASNIGIPVSGNYDKWRISNSWKSGNKINYVTVSSNKDNPSTDVASVMSIELI